MFCLDDVRSIKDEGLPAGIVADLSAGIVEDLSAGTMADHTGSDASGIAKSDAPYKKIHKRISHADEIVI